jgi:hypothetical protein
MSEFKTDNLDAWKDTEVFLLESLRAQLTATGARLREAELRLTAVLAFTEKAEVLGAANVLRDIDAIVRDYFGRNDASNS